MQGLTPHSQATSLQSLLAQMALLPHPQGLQALDRGNEGAEECMDTRLEWGKEAHTLEQPSPWTSEAFEPLGQQKKIAALD